MKRKEATKRGRKAELKGRVTKANRQKLLGADYDAIGLMRVVDLKERLRVLDLRTIGLKTVLVKRLRDALVAAKAVDM